MPDCKCYGSGENTQVKRKDVSVYPFYPCVCVCVSILLGVPLSLHVCLPVHTHMCVWFR